MRRELIGLLIKVKKTVLTLSQQTRKDKNSAAAIFKKMDKTKHLSASQY